MPKVILGLFSIPSLEELKLIDIEQEGKSHGVGSTRKPMWSLSHSESPSTFRTNKSYLSRSSDFKHNRSYWSVKGHQQVNPSTCGWLCCILVFLKGLYGLHNPPSFPSSTLRCSTSENPAIFQLAFNTRIPKRRQPRFAATLVLYGAISIRYCLH